MVTKLLGSTKWLVWIGLWGIAAASQGAPQDKLGAKFSEHFHQTVASNENSFDILVYFKGPNIADVVPSLYATKTDKRRHVVQALKKHTQLSQLALYNTLSNKGYAFERFYVGQAVAIYNVSRADVLALAELPEVEKIRSNARQHFLPKIIKDDLPSPTTQGVEASIASTGADRVWTELGVTGEGIVVAGQDTGIDWDHPGLINSYRGNTSEGVDHNMNWYDAVREPVDTDNPCGYQSPEPCDDHGHGTHTLGTVVGSDNAGNSVGMAPGAKWIGCRNMDAGTGRPSMYMMCFQFFLAPFALDGDPEDGDPDLAADVINNSWGCPGSELCEGDEFVEVLENLWHAGVMVVAAAGNEGSRCSTIADGPAHNSDLVFSVGALDHRSGNIASFSSRGPSAHDGEIGPNVSAPGVNIRSAVPGGGYSSFGWSGTSMASPHVTGQVALIWSAQPELWGDIGGTWDLIQQTATPKTTSQTCGGIPGSDIPNNTYGYGMIDAYNAVSTAMAR